ncbi:hypothetical protein QW180_23605 [Vibrio sinaloensis]|nr:hypothetical protein [Vibrio sinaloensis]
MDTLPALLFSLFIIVPLLTLIHELGHAIPQLFWVKHVTISLGTPRRGFTIPMGKLTIITSATPFHRGFFARYPLLSPLSKEPLYYSVVRLHLGDAISCSVLGKMSVHFRSQHTASTSPQRFHSFKR